MKATLNFETQLHTVPVRNTKLKTHVSERNPDVLVLEVELLYRGVPALLASLVKARRRKRYELTGLSRELFESLDGKRSVGDLIDGFSKKEKLTFFESRGLMMQYLRDLMQRGLIVILPDALPGV